MGAPTVPYPSGVERGVDDAGDIDNEIEYGGAPTCTGTGGGMGFGDDADGDCCVLPAKARVEETSPSWYGVVKGMRESAADRRTYVGYGP